MPTKKVKFIYTLNRPYPPFYVSLIMAGYSSKKVFHHFSGMNYYLPDLQVLNGGWYYPEYHLVDFRDKQLTKLINDKKYFQTLKTKTLKLEKNLDQSSNKDFGSFLKAYVEYAPTLSYYFIMDESLETNLKNLLLEKQGAKKAEKLMSYVTSPLTDNFDRQSKLYLLKTRNINGFLKKYSWLNSRYGATNEYSSSKAEELLSELKKDKYLQKYQEDQKNILKAIKEAKKIIGPKNSHLIDIIQFFIYYRTHRSDILNKAAYNFAPKIKLIGEKFGLSYSEILYCTKEEIMKNKLPKLSIIHDRQKAFSVQMENGKINFLINDKHKKSLESYKNYDEKKTVEIIGRVAYPGKTKGRIRIIRSAADLHNLKSGEILTTAMTTPDMISAMKRACGFITDEGGITCHAAIIARELKKPCIIGTKVATQVLHDNDLVEMDAISGVIKIVG